MLRPGWGSGSLQEPRLAFEEEGFFKANVGQAGARVIRRAGPKCKRSKVWAWGWLPPSPLDAASWLGIWILARAKACLGGGGVFQGKRSSGGQGQSAKGRRFGLGAGCRLRPWMLRPGWGSGSLQGASSQGFSGQGVSRQLPCTNLPSRARPGCPGRARQGLPGRASRGQAGRGQGLPERQAWGPSRAGASQAGAFQAWLPARGPDSASEPELRKTDGPPA